MVRPSTRPCALARGALQFAIVVSVDPGYDQVSGQDPVIAGRLRLMDGHTYPFAGTDSRVPVKEIDGSLHFVKPGDHPASKHYNMRQPAAGSTLMADIEDGQVRYWTRPELVLAGPGFDHRYVDRHYYARNVQYPGLHCLVAIDQLTPGQAAELLAWSGPGFVSPAAYVGHYTDYYLEQSPPPYAFAVFKWDRLQGRSHLVSLTAKLK